jgi:hypothetical protein
MYNCLTVTAANYEVLFAQRNSFLTISSQLFCQLPTPETLSVLILASWDSRYTASGRTRREHRFLYCCVLIHCCRDVFIAPLSAALMNYFDFQASSHYIHKSPPLVRIVSQMNPVHNLPSFFFKNRFNCILSSIPRSFKWYLPLVFSYQNFVRICSFPRELHAPQSSSSWIWLSQ